MIHIEIGPGNAAFGNHRACETARILRELADRLNSFEVVIPLGKRQAYPLVDVNGNRVGRVWEGRS